MTIQKNISLKPFNSFGIDVLAREFAFFSEAGQLEGLLAGREELALVLGGGSNVLFTKDYAGIVLKNEINGIEKIKEDDVHVYVRAGAGEPWHGFVQYCIEHKLAGVENLSLIPGNVGASPMQNIGAYGVELKDVFHSLRAFHKYDKAIVEFDNTACEFGYRESIFKHRYKNQFIITDVVFRLNKNPVYNTSYGAIEQELESMGIRELSLAALSEAVINIRRSKLPDPAVIGNAGSFFKNPELPEDEYRKLKQRFPGIVGYSIAHRNVKLAAGWLIEQCGWKGFRRGDAGCHNKQALVLVNYGNAKGAEILALSEEIIRSVKNKFSVQLEREVNII